MSVAKRRRGWPAWGSSLSNGTGARTQISQRLCAPNPTCQESRPAAGQGHTLPWKGLPLDACLPALPGSTHRCAAGVPPPSTSPRQEEPV